MNLYDINAEIENLIDYETGEITDSEAFDKLVMDKQEKLSNIALLYLNAKSDKDKFKEQKERFQKKEKSAENLMNWCKATLTLELAGSKMRDKERRFNIYYSPSSSVQYTDEKAIPPKWITTKTETVIDKAGIKKELEAGNDVAGAVLVTKQNIQIR
jgi:hypothetical protein